MKSVRGLPQSIKRMAVLHMIGQMWDMQQIVKTSDVATWLGCTKATARTYLDRLENSHAIAKSVGDWRPTVPVHYFRLTEASYRLYQSGTFLGAYNIVLDYRTSTP